MKKLLSALLTVTLLFGCKSEDTAPKEPAPGAHKQELELARAALESGDVRTAISLAFALSEAQPDLHEARVLLANAYILDGKSVEALLEANHIVIAGGGGGVPMVLGRSGEVTGVSGVVDKDLTAALFANHLGADLLVFLTAVDQISTHFGTSKQHDIGKSHRGEIRTLLDDGHFPAGSMGPKVEAALEFLDDGGAAVIVTSAKKLSAALADRGGTRITREPGELTARRQLALFPNKVEEATDPSST